MKLFCFRFDVDTYLCMKKGVPNLLQLAKRLNVNFTFFVNMGRGLSIKSYILKNKKNKVNTGPKLSNIKKLGLVGYIKSILLNPKVGEAHLHIIKEASEQGHEIGLHGGGESWRLDV